VSGDENEIHAVCPVEDCSYSDSIKSVAAHVSGKKDAQHDWHALGYGGYYEYIREQKEAQDSSKSVLVHMTDSHIGRERGGHYGKGWPIDCADGFQKAVEAAISADADAVVHTGDLFHNDTTTGITEDHLESCIIELAKLQDSNIPFYLVLGDHEDDEGEVVREKLEEFEFIRSLDTTPTLVGDQLALYGVDYKPESWWANGRFAPDSPPSGRTTILALHQPLQEFVNPDRAECDAREILQRTQSRRGFRFDAILVGQHHEDVREVVQDCDVLCGGATERISKRSFDPFVRVLTADASGLFHRKRVLDR
jgi:DNA repair exonuclease SbcCD nuclease subunit